MEKEFIPYEQALALKELGFDKPCIKEYHLEELLNNSTDGEIKNSDLMELYGNSVISAPTFSQAFRFFREKYLLFGYPFPNDYQNYGYRIVEMTSDENKELVYDWGTKDTCEDAELACLKKLIEIVKEK
jgi:hypothetical protein